MLVQKSLTFKLICTSLTMSNLIFAQKPDFFRGIANNPFQGTVTNFVAKFPANMTPWQNYGHFFEIVRDGQPDYGALSPVLLVGRKVTTNNGAQSNMETGLSVVHDALHSTGTPVGILSILRSNITTSNGTAAIYGRVYKQALSTDISIGLHGECFNESDGGACIGFNSEVYNQTNLNSASEFIGLVIQSGVNSVGSKIITKAQTNHVFHPGTNTNGWIADFNAETGIHPVGMRIREGASGGNGNITKALILSSKKNTPNILEMNNQPGNVNAAPNQILFSRGDAIQQSIIESDTSAAGTLNYAKITFKLRNNEVMEDLLTMQGEGRVVFNRGYIQHNFVNIAATTTLNIGMAGYAKITAGATNITSITGCDAGSAGRVLYSTFEVAGITVTDGGNLKLAGNLISTLDSALTLICNGVNWSEQSRSLN